MRAVDLARIKRASAAGSGLARFLGGCPWNARIIEARAELLRKLAATDGGKE